MSLDSGKITLYAISTYYFEVNIFLEDFCLFNATYRENLFLLAGEGRFNEALQTSSCFLILS